MISKRTPSTPKNIQGFTIVELMIATIVFSVIMLIATATVIYVSKTYVKGQVESETQQSARNILNMVSQDIAFTRGATIAVPAGQVNHGNAFEFCIGNHVYLYQLDVELNPQGTTSMTSNNVAEMYVSSSCPPAPFNLSTLPLPSGSTAEELLSTHERLGQLSVDCLDTFEGGPWKVGDACANATYRVTVTVAYGDDDVLNDTAARKVPPPYLQWSPDDSFNYHCVETAMGGNFCAVSTLTTTVRSRIN